MSVAVKWQYVCDGAGCSAVALVAPLELAPVGWLTRTTVDRVLSLDEPATGTGFPGGRSELQRINHYCPVCRRKPPTRVAA
jgi:hypothetical protein